MSGLRFAMVTTFYPPYSFGGDAVGVRRLSRALVRRGHEVTVIHDIDAFNAVNDGPEPPPEPSRDGVEVVSLRSGLGAISPLLTHQTGRPVVQGGRVEDLLAEGDFDVIHYHNVSLVGGPGVLSVGSGLKVYEAHEHWLVCPTHVLWRHKRERCDGRECLRCVLRYRRPPQLWRYTGYLDRQLDHVDAFIAKSEFSRRKHREFGFDREMEVLPYFLPDRREAGDGAAEAGAGDGSATERSEGGSGATAGGDRAAGAAPSTPHQRPYFLFVGRLERIKGLDEVIPVFRDYTDADLLIAGDGTHEDALRRLAADAPGVRFLGRLSSEALAAYYAGALALIVPSVCFETFGIILIESFRQGTPVIARDLGPFPEIVRACGGGELFSDTRELRDALERVQGDPGHRERLARRALEGFDDLWSETAVVPRYLELIGRAAAASGRPELASRRNGAGRVRRARRTPVLAEEGGAGR